MLRGLLLDESAEPAARLRAACILDKIDPEAAVHAKGAGAALKLALMTEDRRHDPALGRTARVDCAGRLFRRCLKDCRDAAADSAARTQVAEALAEILTRGQGVRRARPGSWSMPSPTPPESFAAPLRRSAGASRPCAFLRGVLDERIADAATEFRKDEVASRQAEAAITLAVLGDSEPLWPLLSHSPDPRLRAWLIHTLAESGLAAQVLLDRLTAPGLDAAQRQAILLALAEAHPAGSTLPARARFIEAAAALYQKDPDPGVHSAAELLLRRSDRDDVLKITVAPQPPHGHSRRRGWATLGGRPQRAYLRDPPRPARILDGVP